MRGGSRFAEGVQRPYSKQYKKKRAEIFNTDFQMSADANHQNIQEREREGELLLEGVRDMKGERDNREKEKKLKKKNLRLSTKAPLP